MMRPPVILLLLAAASNLPAQAIPPNSLGEIVLSEKSALEAAPDFAAWRNSHPNERVKNAAYDNEYESQGLWCAASVADYTFPGGLKATRQAFFYAPAGKPGSLLPDHQDAELLRQCRLRALWYEVSNPADSAGLARSVSAELGVSFGAAAEPSRFQKRDFDWGSGNWNPYMVWDRANLRVVLAVDPGGPIPDPRARTRLLVIARSSLAPRGISFDWMGEAPKGQPSLQGAPEIASVARVEKPCAFDDGNNNWQDGLIRFGEKLLRDFPASRWRSYVHLTMARTYANWLTLAYPGIDLDGATRPNNPDVLRREGIAHFRAFLDENPGSPEADSAWREAWRLLAGLPPSPIHFACTD
jgi:hypothetical protein